MCGLNYGSKSALGLHYNNKHIFKNNEVGDVPYDEKKVQKCGCGLVYQSRSALNMHVKKKHEGKYPEGTTRRPNLRSNPGERDEQNQIESYLIRNQSNSE